MYTYMCIFIYIFMYVHIHIHTYMEKESCTLYDYMYIVDSLSIKYVVYNIYSIYYIPYTAEGSSRGSSWTTGSEVVECRFASVAGLGGGTNFAKTWRCEKNTRISLEFRAFSLPSLHSSRRAVQFSPILGSVRRFEAQHECISSYVFATSGFCNVGSPTLWIVQYIV